MTHAWRSAAQAPAIRSLVGALLAALVLFAAPRAHAQLDAPRAASSQLGRQLDDPTPTPVVRPSDDDGWHLDLAAVTSLPLSVGAEATVQSPVGLFAQLSVGHTPQAYMGVVSGAIGDAGAYDDDLDGLVSEATANGGWNVRAGLGFTIPEGLELSVGYTWLTASSELSPGSIEAAIGQRVRWPGMTVVPIHLDIHALYGRVGWRLVVEDHFVARVALGWTHAVGSSTRVEVPPEIRERPNDPATRMEEAVSEGLGEYGFTPELLMSAGYRF